jgi:TatA/E family protein of Tat protein translocase
MGSLSPWHWAIVAAVVIVLFGAKRLPDAARSLGKSMRIFKSEIHELHADEADAVVAPRPRRALSCNPSQRSPQYPSNVGAELHLPRVRPGAAAWPSTGDESRR